MVELIIIVVCLGLNALFACFEMAFVTVTKVQLKQLAKTGTSAAGRILALRENPERTLSIIQVGITLVGMVSAAVGGAGAEESFAPVLEQRFGLPENVAEATAILLVVVPLTLFSVILGELVPKTIALRDPLRISLIGARWIGIADTIFSPIVTFLEIVTKWILSLIPRKKTTVTTEPTTSVELEHLSQQTQQYVLNLVSIETRRVRDVYVPWEQVNLIQESDSVADVTTAVIRSGHTRLPVCRDQTVIGLLHTKEFIVLLSTAPENWHGIIRPVIEVSENELALRVLRLMQEKRSHMAIVVDAASKPLGIVTLEDIIEEVVGDLFDEDDDGKIRKLLSSSARWRARPPR